MMQSKVNVFLLGILIFVLGGITGAVSHSLYQEYLKAAFFKRAAQPPDIIGGMARELGLDAAQTDSLRRIFEESRQRYIDLSKQFWPHYEKIRIETDQRIRDMLREDQKKRFEDFLKKTQPPPMRFEEQEKEKPTQGRDAVK